MSGVIKLKDVVLHTFTVIDEYGIKIYLVCLHKGILSAFHLKKPETFLSIVSK